MKSIRVVLALAGLLVFAGCASVPSPEEVGKLPVVRFGEAVPAGGEYILYFPPDTPIRTNVSIKGNIFAKEAEQPLSVTLKRGIYAYKTWVSYDGVSWQSGRKTIHADVVVKIPGYGHPEPGTVAIRLDDRG